LSESFQKLPGIGPKTAQRLAYYLLHVPQTELDSFSENLSELKRKTVICGNCKNVEDTDPCSICSDSKRDHTKILVVEQPLDVIAFEKTGKYNGLYHVLHGAISPLENIGPDEIFIDRLLERLKGNGSPIKEVILATNPNMEGDATAMYMSKKIKQLQPEIQVSRLGMGIPTGADLEFADEVTLTEALNGRRLF
jgi:recombination protein RecR